MYYPYLATGATFEKQIRVVLEALQRKTLCSMNSASLNLKKSTRRYLLYLPISYVLAEKVEYTKDTFASPSLEICTPGRSYFGYSMFPGVMLASLMHSPESLFSSPATAFTSFSALILLNHDK
jgi:hypothetical protein